MQGLKKIFVSFSGKEKKIFWTASAIALGAVLISGFFLIQKITKPLPARGGVFVEGMVGQPAFLNPILASSEVDKSLVRLLFSRLETLASQIEPSADGKIWKIRIKEEVLWSDQEKLTSEDVLFTILKIKDEETRSPLYESWRGVAVKRVSELEVEFDASASDVSIEDNIRNLYVAPEHIFGEVPASNWGISDFNLQPVGSGAYVFQNFKKRANGFIEEYKLKLNSDYFHEKPLIQEFNFAFFGEMSELVEAFNRARIDGFGGLTLKEIREIKRPYLNFSFKLPNYYALFINQSRNAALKEVAVRRALSLAAPRSEIVAETLGSLASTAWGPIPEDTIFYNPKVKEKYASSETPEEILEKAGWKLEDGKREKMVGKTMMPLQIVITLPDIDFLKEAAEKVKIAWEKLGVKVSFLVLPEENIKDAIRNRDYEMVLYGNILNKKFDLSPFWHSNERFHPGLNLSLYSSGSVDKLIRQISEEGSGAENREKFNEVQNLITEDFPAIFIFSLDYIYIANTNLKGVQIEVMSEPADHLNSVGNWHLKTVRVLK